MKVLAFLIAVFAVLWLIGKIRSIKYRRKHCRQLHSPHHLAGPCDRRHF